MQERKISILMVDDHLDEIGFALSYLTSAGYNVTTACSGEAALIASEAGDFDFFLLDIHMPNMSGIDVCKALRATEKYDGTPIIFITADCEETSEIAGLEVGGDEYITKPFSATALEVRISRMLKARARQHVLSQKLRRWRDKANTDELTGLHRRDYVDRLPTNMHGLGIAMLDVDHFKSVNDEHGHPAGDECLRQVAAVIRRFDQNAIRMGGEEFLVVVDDGNTVKELAESLCSVIEAEIKRPCGAALTVSIGAINIDDAVSTTAKHAIACADKLLYESKNGGRNCVTTSNISDMRLGRRFRDQME